MDDTPRTIQEYQQFKRTDQYKKFFVPTLADKQDDYYGPIRPVLGYELSTANLEKEDLKSFNMTVKMILELANHGVFELLMDTQTAMTADLDLTRSIDGGVLNYIFSNKIEYSQNQTLHEYQHPVERKRGLFSRG